MRQRHLACAGALLALCLAGSAARAHDQSHGAGTASATSGETPFLTENAAAMDKMMADMEVKPTGDIDADFTAMMIPHHQGAIDMAVAYLRYGQNPLLRRLAQEIVVEQQQEIAAMRLALGQPLPPSAPAPTEPDAAPLSDHSTQSHSTMSAGSMPMPASSMPMK
ncbi:MAG: DUF305 domain-containing protein [Rhizobiales bacterium 24-66-13]|jgi:uncharacterized protein (DUF305 family)|uniref:DUF305 domain-containing protein n=1 Tax=Roseixanthobacter finlandensis TaxID=3119922 RepID=UPI000BDD4EDE|nr:MAG: DUF305 domain-containing protein [Rhizobiales bacterium 35-66-30]OYZ75195.1 MAG: DUF305 domain-containing protein [Rhizobiales bacterium 24-66-13]OZB06140.1 MAG: DUF305 domain-containing protein [Rhizobiales bacterium 39-66-18]HQS09338.1 DUF305 domain-containing protein [Xanthobacteraceae bacterium]HQS48454.1 DUF305 domain-containing protein [Xanthobacteraceae bacterium]